MRVKLLALFAGAAISLTAVAPASAAPWDGEYFDFGFGEWSLTNFYMNDVDLHETALNFTQPHTDGYYTDIWDAALGANFTSVSLGLDFDQYDCNIQDSIDLSVDGTDVVVACNLPWDVPAEADVDITADIRIFGPDADLTRYTYVIANNSDTAITDLSVKTYTNFGSTGWLWAYQNVDANVLAVPASETIPAADDYAAAVEETGSNWAVHANQDDAPGSLAWGNEFGEIDVELFDISGDTYYTQTDTITIPAGETVRLVYFLGWDPVSLNAVEYDVDYFTVDADQVTASDAVVAAAAEFNDFSGRLLRGLPENANVLNWGPAEDAELADTGTDTSSLWAALGLLIGGAGIVAVRRRISA